MMSLKEKLKNELKNFTDNWSGHGVHRIAISGNIVKKLFYSGVFITCIVLFAYQIRLLILKYYSYPVNTLLTIHHDSLRFPAVTICNKNIVRKSKLSLGGSILQAVVNRSEETFGAGKDYNYNNYTDFGSGSESESVTTSSPGSDAGGSTTDTYSYYDYWTDNAGSGSQEDLFQTPAEDIYYDTAAVPWLTTGQQTGETAATQDISMALVKVNISSRLEMGHQLTEMLQSCSINRETCSTTNFTAFYNALYGNCYTFNGMKTAWESHSFQSGPMFGLKLELVIEQDEYIGSHTRTAGVRLTVHDPYDFPFPEDNGIDLAPGKETSVALKLKYVKKLGPPYSDCTTGTGRTIAYKGKYTSLACIKTCLQDSIVQMCNCTDTRYSNANFYTVGPCDNDTDYQCISQALTMHYSTNNCDCPPACTSNVYQQTVSSADYPSINSQDELRDIIANRSPRLAEILNNGTVPNNVLQVLVFFETLQHEKITEQAAYDFESLVSDVGGQAGLLIGWSLISFVEIIEFLGNLIWIVIKYLVFRQASSTDTAVRVSPAKQI